MPVTQDELDHFHSFASQRIKQAEDQLTWDELIVLWESTCRRDDVNAAIRRGLADVEEGRYEPANEAMEQHS